MARWLRYTLLVAACYGAATCGDGGGNGGRNGLPDSTAGDGSTTDGDADADADADSDVDADTDADSDGSSWQPVVLDPADCPANSDGVIISDNESPTMNRALHAQLAWTGSQLFVVWVTPGNPTDPPRPSRIYYSLVDPASNFSAVVDDTELAATSWRDAAVVTDVHWDGSSLHVVWAQAVDGEEEPGRVFHQRVDGSGALAGSAQPLNTGGPAEWAAMGQNGSDLLVLWAERNDEGGQGDLYGRVLNLAGTPQGAASVMVGGQLTQTAPAVAPGGGGFLAVFSRTSFLPGSTEDTTPGLSSTVITGGTAATPQPLVDDFTARAPHTLLSVTGGYALLYQGGYAAQEAALYLLAMDANGVAQGTPVLLDDRATSVAALYDGTELVVVTRYSDTTRRHAQLWVTRYGTDGSRASEPRALACVDNEAGLRHPAVVSTGSDYVVAWSQPGEQPFTHVALQTWQL